MRERERREIEGGCGRGGRKEGRKENNNSAKMVLLVMHTRDSGKKGEQ